MSGTPIYPSLTILGNNYPLNPDDYSLGDKDAGTIKVKKGSFIQEVSIGQKVLNLKILGKPKTEIDALQAKATQDLINFYNGIEGDINGQIDGYFFTNALLYKATPKNLYLFRDTTFYYEECQLTIVSLRLDYLI